MAHTPSSPDQIIGTAVPVTGTGPGGKVTPQDVLNRIQQEVANGLPMPPGFEMGDDGKVQPAEDFGSKFAEFAKWGVIVGLSATMIYGAFAAPGAAASIGAEPAVDSEVASTATTGLETLGETVPVAGGVVPAADAPGFVEGVSGAFDASGNFVADGTTASSGGTLSKIATALSGKSGVSSLLGAAGQGIGAATTAAGNNALNQEKLGLQANQQNIQGEEAFQNELLAMAKEEQSQRKGALQDEYLAGYARQPGSMSPAASSPAAMDSLTSLEHQAATTLANGAKYSTNNMPAPAPYKQIPINDVQGATGTKPSTLQTIGTWLSPTLTVASKIAPYL